MIAATDLYALGFLITATATAIGFLWEKFSTARKLADVHAITQDTNEKATHTNESVNGIAPNDQTIRENVQQLVDAHGGPETPVIGNTAAEGLSQMVRKLLQDQAAARAALDELRALLEKNGTNGGGPKLN